jgi:DNA-binding NtrC family response regulator
MSITDMLTPSERKLFTLVSRAAFLNPFSEDRKQLDLQITELPLTTPREKILEAVKDKISQTVKTFEQKNRACIKRFDGDDYNLVRHTLLFTVYYEYRDHFLRLINDQTGSGETPCKVLFAKQALKQLADYGFSEADACRYFALIYQMRRAYYFIEHGLVGTSSCMKQLRLDLWNNVFTYDIGLYEKYLWNRMEDFSTILLGETGTGKGNAAAAIGRSGFIPFNQKKECFEDSFTSSFIPLNLSQFPESIIESELFGHKKGSFTGAVDDHKGVFEQCGTYSSIFLDEIGEVSVPVQIKLLQILQERLFSPVGSHKKLRFQGRVIAATNHDLQELRSEGTFRDDFFYRLCSDTIIVPPLRQRLREDPSELDALLAHSVERMVGKPSPELVEVVKNVIMKSLGKDYIWPGNVRELEQCVRRILLKRDYSGDEGTRNDDLKTKITIGIETGTFNANELLSNYCTLLYEQYGTFEEVARRTNLDRRTVKKYIFCK